MISPWFYRQAAKIQENQRHLKNTSKVPFPSDKVKKTYVMFGGPYNTLQNILKYIGMDVENKACCFLKPNLGVNIQALKTWKGSKTIPSADSKDIQTFLHHINFMIQCKVFVICYCRICTSSTCFFTKNKTGF